MGDRHRCREADADTRRAPPPDRSSGSPRTGPVAGRREPTGQSRSRPASPESHRPVRDRDNGVRVPLVRATAGRSGSSLPIPTSAVRLARALPRPRPDPRPLWDRSASSRRRRGTSARPARPEERAEPSSDAAGSVIGHGEPVCSTRRPMRGGGSRVPAGRCLGPLLTHPWRSFGGSEQPIWRMGSHL